MRFMQGPMSTLFDSLNLPKETITDGRVFSNLLVPNRNFNEIYINHQF